MTLQRAFHWSNKAYYSHVIDEKQIMFGMYEREGGTSGEMSMTWHELGGKSVPKLEVFDDAWKILETFSDVISELSKVDNKNITQEQFVELLKSKGFADFTRYESPYQSEEKHEFVGKNIVSVSGNKIKLDDGQIVEFVK